MTAKETIDKLGGWKKVAKMVGLEAPNSRCKAYNTIYAWARRNKIPAHIDRDYRLTEKAARKS